MPFLRLNLMTLPPAALPEILKLANSPDVATEIPQIDFSKDQATLVVKTKNNEKLGRKGGDVNSDFTFDHVFK